MENIEEFKKSWSQNKAVTSGTDSFNEESLRKIIKQRAKQQQHISMKYFWASFTLQIIVYALLSHVMVKYWADTPVSLISIFCTLLYVPFTVMLLNKFKRMAILKVDNEHTAGLPIYEYVSQQHALLASFYRFKRKYELILIPLSSAILIWIFFRIYLPGGVNAYPIAAIVCFLITLASCMAAIVAENKKRFRQPLAQLDLILKDFAQ